MMDPEIDRRCSHCGASVRSRAVFCPQCGEPIPGQSPEDADSEPTANEAETAPTVALPRDAHWDPAETRPLMSISDFSETQPIKPTAGQQEPSIQETRNPQKATEAARGNVLGRVDRIRKASGVVIDQAAYDPSLRFILVAAALFLLFLFLLIVSKLLG